MPRGYKVRDEDKQAIIDLVREEIVAHRAGRLKRLSTNRELGEIVGCHECKIPDYLKELADKERHYRFSSTVGAAANKTTEQDKQALLQLVREEIESHRDGRHEGLSSNDELAEIVGRDKRTITRYLKGLDKEEREYRVSQLLIVSGKKNGEKNRDEKIGVHGLTKEQRIENSRCGGHIGGKEVYRKRVGVFAIEPEKMAVICARGGSIGGKVSGKDNRHKNRGIFAMSGAERSAFGKRNYNAGVGIAQLTFQQRSAAGKKGGKIGGKIGGRRTIELHGCPFSRLTPEQRRTNGLKGGKIASEALRRTRYAFNGNHYDSQSEATVATLLEKYIPEFRIEEGKTYQVNHDIPKSIDFLVDGTFVEWHPILMFAGRANLGDMPSVQKYHNLTSPVNHK